MKTSQKICLNLKHLTLTKSHNSQTLLYIYQDSNFTRELFTWFELFRNNGFSQRF